MEPEPGLTTQDERHAHMRCWVSVLSCLLLACLYVGSLYVWRSSLPRYTSHQLSCGTTMLTPLNWNRVCFCACVCAKGPSECDKAPLCQCAAGLCSVTCSFKGMDALGWRQCEYTGVSILYLPLGQFVKCKKTVTNQSFNSDPRVHVSIQWHMGNFSFSLFFYYNLDLTARLRRTLQRVVGPFYCYFGLI